MFELLKRNMNDAFKLLFNELDVNDWRYDLWLFNVCLQYNHDKANYLLDLQINEMIENTHINEKSLYNRFNKTINMQTFIVAIQKFNEEIVVKMFKLYQSTIENDSLIDITLTMIENLSNKMIIRLIDRIPFFQNNNHFLTALETFDHSQILVNYVNEKMNKNEN